MSFNSHRMAEALEKANVIPAEVVEEAKNKEIRAEAEKKAAGLKRIEDIRREKEYLENCKENFSCGCISFGGICCIFRSLFICFT